MLQYRFLMWRRRLPPQRLVASTARRTESRRWSDDGDRDHQRLGGSARRGM